jgi:hypothetical protein
MTFNEWWLSLPVGRQKVLIEDKWMLANAAFEATQERNIELENLLNRVVQLWSAHETKDQLAESICKLAPIIRDSIK